MESNHSWRSCFMGTLEVQNGGSVGRFAMSRLSGSILSSSCYLCNVLDAVPMSEKVSSMFWKLHLRVSVCVCSDMRWPGIISCMYSHITLSVPGIYSTSIMTLTRTKQQVSWVASMFSYLVWCLSSPGSDLRLLKFLLGQFYPWTGFSLILQATSIKASVRWINVMVSTICPRLINPADCLFIPASMFLTFPLLSGYLLPVHRCLTPSEDWIIQSGESIGEAVRVGNA